VIAADAERHALGDAAAELRMQQRVELLAVSRGKRGIEGAGEIGGAALCRRKNPFFGPSVINRVTSNRRTRRSENTLEAVKRWCYY